MRERSNDSVNSNSCRKRDSPLSRNRDSNSCRKPDSPSDNSAQPEDDADGDGVLVLEDCNDRNSDVYPGVTETCNEVDDDCDDDTDEGLLAVYYPDQDQDGLGAGDPTEFCTAPEGYASEAGDCDDQSEYAEEIYPGAPELCDGQDNDCDGTIDENIPSWYADSDGDGVGAGEAMTSCNQPDGYEAGGDDCDDDDKSIMEQQKSNTTKKTRIVMAKILMTQIVITTATRVPWIVLTPTQTFIQEPQKFATTWTTIVMAKRTRACRLTGGILTKITTVMAATLKNSKTVQSPRTMSKITVTETTKTAKFIPERPNFATG